MRNKLPMVALGWVLACGAVALSQDEPPDPLHFIDTGFEHASPLWWEREADGLVRIHLVYDQERASPNRANGHWLFRLEAEPGSRLMLNLGPFANIWNRRPSGPIPEPRVAYVSDDGQTWRPIDTEPAEPHRLQFPVRMQGDSLYVARLQPYGLNDLERWKTRIAPHPRVEIDTIGRTVEQRELEIIRVGRGQAPHRILIRARAHPWEPGGNWVLEGLVDRLLRDDQAAPRFLARYAVDIMPMANKDGVARGMTRFNVRGKDLNRNWDRPADPQLAPENAALERWLEARIAAGQRPDLMLDFHNDASGQLHISRPELEPAALEAYLARMEHLERVLRQHTWFTEGSTRSTFRNPGSIGEGLLARYGIAAVVHELNAHWIAGLDDYPSPEHWRLYGHQLAEAFFHYFEPCDSPPAPDSSELP